MCKRHVHIHTPYLGTIFDGHAEHTGHLAAVGELEASPNSSPDQDFVEDELVLIQDVNPFSLLKLLGGEQSAAGTQVMLFKDGGHV